MSHNSPNTSANLSFFATALEGFAREYDIDLQVFGDYQLHWRLSNISTTLDCWPMTGKYYIKDMPIGCKELRQGMLPHDYTQLNHFLKRLFIIEEMS